MKTMLVERVSKKAFDSLPEYSCSIPTGKTIGKVWKRKCEDGWVIGEYTQADEKNVYIQWRKLEIAE